MKTSNKIILLAIMVAFGSLIFYNFKLKAKYDTKAYRDRFHDMDFTAIAGLKKLDIESANRIGIQIEYGTKEGLWVPKVLKNKIKIIAYGNNLKLDLVADANGKAPLVKAIFLILIAKDLNRIVARHTDRKKETNASQSNMRLKGFILTKLDLQVSSDTRVYFDNVYVDTLNATVGGDDYAGKAELILPFNATINEASFNIGINGALNLQGAKVLKTQSTVPNPKVVAAN